MLHVCIDKNRNNDKKKIKKFNPLQYEYIYNVVSIFNIK